MADDVFLRKLKEGVTAWNEWRPSDPRFRADLSGADLSGADLTGANLSGANLSGANLKDADLQGANLTGATLPGANLMRVNLTDVDLTAADLTAADLSGAILFGANLMRVNLTNAVLSGTNLTAASLGDAIFTGARVNSETQGLNELSDDQRDGLVHVDRDPDAGAQSDAPSRAAQITVGTAQRIVGPAHEVLSGLPIPNDLSEAHLDLFLEIRRTVADLKRELAGVTDQNKLMSGEIEALGKAQKALPVWRATWTTFIASAAGVGVGAAGASAASYTAGYTAGFIAGVLHDTFSPDSLCIMT